MAGRNDYGVLRSSLLSDDRAEKAADAMAAAGLTSKDLALSATVGVIVELGLWAMRETDDGVLPGDGIGAMRHATLMPRDACIQVIAILRAEKLLREVEGGLYLVGFRECYASILRRRETNRECAAETRSKASASRSSQREKKSRQREAKQDGIHPESEQGDTSGTNSQERNLSPHVSPIETDATTETCDGLQRQQHVSMTSATRQHDVSVTSDTNGAERSVAKRSSPPTPSGGGGSSASPGSAAPLTAGERAVAAVILAALEAGRLAVESTEDAAERMRAAKFAQSGHEEDRERAKARHAELVEQARQRRAAAIDALRAGGPDARPWIERLQHAEPVRLPCVVARKGARADERDQRRRRA